MKKLNRRFLAILLAALMTVSSVVPAFADTPEPEIEVAVEAESEEIEEAEIPEEDSDKAEAPEEEKQTAAEPEKEKAPAEELLEDKKVETEKAEEKVEEKTEKKAGEEETTEIEEFEIDDSTMPVDEEIVMESVMEIEEVLQVEGDLAVEEALAGVNMLGDAASIGDLWDEKWSGVVGNTFESMHISGDGSEATPYVIETINQLMWVSGQIAMGSSGFNTAYYNLAADLDYSGAYATYGFWHPIGWAKNKTELADATQIKAFKGHFDGKNHKITGIQIQAGTAYNLQNVGLFGIIEDGVVENLTVQATRINGYDYVGILAGQMRGTAEVHNVTVKGSVDVGHTVSEGSSSAHVGGVVGAVNGDSLSASGAAIIENTFADNVSVVAIGGMSVVGGIVGSAVNAYIVDNEVISNSTYPILCDGGYAGGICGDMADTAVYNSVIAGTIGGNGGRAVGGVVGNFISGEIYLVQMNGKIGKTNAGTKYEGIVIGYRSEFSDLRYGTQSTDNAGYLFYDEQLNGGAVSGAGWNGDATGFTKAAHVGFDTANKVRYTIVEGNNPYPCEDDEYFFEELERGVTHIVTQRLGKNFTVQDYADGLRFKIDHYAAGKTGTPVPGHLLTIPVINSQSDPTLYTNVATFIARAGDGSNFYKTMDYTSCVAVAPGTIVTVESAPINRPTEVPAVYFQRKLNLATGEPYPPTYTETDSDGYTEIYDMAYAGGGAYSFTMPDSDCEINILYENAVSHVSTSPIATEIFIKQVRTGNRKKPTVTWTIKNENGYPLCNEVSLECPAAGTAYTWQFLTNEQVTYVPIDVVFDAASTLNEVKWTPDDYTLIHMADTPTSYTKNAAHIKPVVTVDNTWLSQILAEETQKQANNNYSTKMSNTPYSKTAVLTATTNPVYSQFGQPVYAHCDVKFTFQIDDQTTLLTEGVSLDKDSLVYTVKRKITGHRRAPITTWEVTGEQALKATITPEDADIRDVDWELTGDAATAFQTLAPTGNHDHDLALILNFDGSDLSKLPEWMKELYDADNAAKTADLNYVMCKEGEKIAVVKVTAQDKELNVHTADATITVKYVTEDTTVDVDEFSLDTDSIVFNVTRNLSGDRTNPTEDYVITSPKKITGFLSADEPFLEDVKWAYDSNITLAVTRKLSGSFKEENLIGVNFDPENIESAPAWIGNVIRADDDKWKEDKKYWKRSAEATVSGYVTATSNDVTLPDGTAEQAKCLVTINFKTNDETVIHPEGVEMNPVEINKKLVIEKTGDIKSSTKSVTGFNAENIKSQVLPNLSFIDEHEPYNRAVKWTVSDEDVIGITQDGLLTINQASKWIQELQSAAPYKGKKTVYVYCTTLDNGKVGATTVNLDFETICVEEEFDAKNVDLKLTATGSRSNPTYTWTGADPFNVTAKTYPDEREVTYSSSDPTAVSIDKNGKVTINTDRNQQWIKDALAKSPYTAEKIVTLTAKDGSHVDTATVKLAFSYKDSTYSSSSSGGGGGGGGGISGGGTSVGTGLSKTVTGLPTYVISGTWVQSADGTWRFSSGRTYTSEWACVFNPYASGDQAQFDWFRFDNKSIMVRGWFDDPADGNRYYLWPLEDGTQGHMCVGCQYIDGAWYYFNEKSDGTRGKLMRSATVVASDGKTIATDASGRIISVNGNVAEIASLKPTPNTTASLIASGVISAVGATNGPGSASGAASGVIVAPANYKTVGF